MYHSGQNKERLLRIRQEHLTKNCGIAFRHGALRSNVTREAEENDDIFPFAEPLRLQAADEEVGLIFWQRQTSLTELR